MCGRYVISKPVSKTIDLVKTNIKVEDSDNFNAHPSQKLPVIKSYTNGKALELCEWGLVPDWSKKLDKFSPLINARKETLMEKVTFKNLIQASRCVVPADGYVSVKIYNLIGQEVATLQDGYMDQNFNGYKLNWNASNLASGVYLVRAESAGTVSLNKLMLLK